MEVWCLISTAELCNVFGVKYAGWKHFWQICQEGVEFEWQWSIEMLIEESQVNETIVEDNRLVWSNQRGKEWFNRWSRARWRRQFEVILQDRAVYSVVILVLITMPGQDHAGPRLRCMYTSMPVCKRAGISILCQVVLNQTALLTHFLPRPHPFSCSFWSSIDRRRSQAWRRLVACVPTVPEYHLPTTLFD